MQEGIILNTINLALNPLLKRSYTLRRKIPLLINRTDIMSDYLLISLFLPTDKVCSPLIRALTSLVLFSSSSEQKRLKISMAALDAAKTTAEAWL